MHNKLLSFNIELTLKSNGFWKLHNLHRYKASVDHYYKISDVCHSKCEQQGLSRFSSQNYLVYCISSRANYIGESIFNRNKISITIISFYGYYFLVIIKYNITRKSSDFGEGSLWQHFNSKKNMKNRLKMSGRRKCYTGSFRKNVSTSLLLRVNKHSSKFYWCQNILKILITFCNIGFDNLDRIHESRSFLLFLLFLGPKTETLKI